jgi:8-oxo-dGTP diphosphatase
MTVVAAVIERDGRVLICQRRPGKRHPLKWEFPGGKVEPEEDPRDALQRELREELAIEAQVGEELDQYEVRYADGKSIGLRFYRVTEFTGEPRNLEFERMVWETKARLGEYDFLEGDVKFVRRLSGQ